MLASILTAGVLECASGPASPPLSAVIAAERAFAADASSGFTAAFRKHIAPDGVLFRPDPVLGSAALADQEDAPGAVIDWWPAFSGVAASGDLGFSIGPFVVGDPPIRGGFFMTVWRKEVDGVWRFVLDRGPRPKGLSPYPKAGPVACLPTYSGPPIPNPGMALEEVRNLEVALTRDLASDLQGGFLPRLADDAWVMGSEVQPERGLGFARAELERRPKTAAMQPVGGGQSSAGDLVYTYGYVSWTKPDQSEVRGHYVRIWQRRGATWKIVTDEFLEPLIPAPAAPQKPAA